jgi:hemoglobin
VAEQGVDADAIRQAVNRFYERVLADPVLAPLFEGVDMVRLHKHQSQFLLHILGGAERHSARELKDTHGELAITDSLFDRMVAHLIVSLREVGVAQDVVDRAGTDVETLRTLIVTAQKP